MEMPFCSAYHNTMYRLHKLELVLNSAARLLCRIPFREHITPTLKSLHWLPVRSRIDFKIALLTFKCLHGEGPQYLRELLHVYQPTRQLRSSDAGLLRAEPATCSLGCRAFNYAAPSVWNSLPLHVSW